MESIVKIDVHRKFSICYRIKGRRICPLSNNKYLSPFTTHESFIVPVSSYRMSTPTDTRSNHSIDLELASSQVVDGEGEVSSLHLTHIEAQSLLFFEISSVIL